MLYISEPDVLTVLNNLPATKATGPDAVGNHILKSISLWLPFINRNYRVLMSVCVSVCLCVCESVCVQDNSKIMVQST